jgi:ABC-type multidrug transport system fused ATPase/permease subunit
LKKNNEKPKYSVLSNVIYILDGIREYDKWLLLFVLVNVIFASFGQFVPVIMPKLIIDQLTNGGNAKTVIILSVAFGAAMFLANGIANTSESSISTRFISVRLKFIAHSGKKFMTTDFQNLENPKVLDMSQKGDRACNNNADGIEGIMHRTQWAASKILTLLSMGTVISFLNPVIIVAILILLSINFYVSSKTRKLDKKENDLLAPVWRKLGYIGGTMSDFSYAKDIRLFGMQSFLNDKYIKEQDNRFKGQVKIWRYWTKVANISAVTSLLQEVILYIWLCWRVLYGHMSIGDFVMYAAAIRTFSSTLGGLLDDISHIRQQNEIVCDYRAFLDYPDISTGKESLPQKLGNKELCFEFEDVSFKYPGREEYALRNLNFRIDAGERLAIVGLNGAGKTTFIKLLTRLYEPESGRILLNGVDIKNYNKREYYSLFSVVFQEIEMFAFTVAENVSMKEYKKTNFNEVRMSIDKAGLKSKIDTLQHDIDTTVLKIIDEGGVEFSGGESQKLALARALYKNAPCVVLDEPTAALDSLAEERLYKNFDSLIGSKTAVYISHRLASTRFCDRIAMFECGQIIETGTHDELMRKGGRYAEIFDMQAKYYKEGVAVL